MTERQIAESIPAEYRREILHTDMISQTVASASDPGMSYLVIIWKNYLEPDLNITCGNCLVRILDGFKRIQPHLIDIEKQSKLLQLL